MADPAASTKADTDKAGAAPSERAVLESQTWAFEADFEAPGVLKPMSPDVRQARAAEYTAYQLGQINRKLDRLVAALEALAKRG